MKTWNRPSEPSKLSSNCSNQCPMQTKGENGKYKTVRFFHQKGTLSTLQCGGRAKRTTNDHILSLETTATKSLTNSELVASIFFDMEKAYDSTRRHDILMDIKEAGIEVMILNFIQNFLKSRPFKLTVNEILSDTDVQTEGVSQGSVASHTYFILKINKIVAQLPNDN